LAALHEVHIIFPNNSPEKNTFNISSKISIKSIGPLGSTIIKKILNLISCIKYINSNKQDEYVIISDPIMVLLIKFINAKNIIRFIQGDDYRIFDDRMIIRNGFALYLYKKFCKRAYKANCLYIFNSRYTYANYVQVSKQVKTPFQFVYPAINHQFFFDNPTRDYDKEKVNIAIVGRKHPFKGLSTFIDAWKMLPLEVKLRIGRVRIISHDDLSSFETDAFEIFTPCSDSDLANILRDSDLFISTSWSEGFGLPPLEAMACGCSVILSDSGGVLEYATSDLNCLMFKPKDHIGLKEAMVSLINNRNLRKKLSLNGIEISKNFNWGKSADQLLEIISQSKKHFSIQ